MKKLLVAAAIALVAIASEAASVNWSINNIQSSPNVSAAAGWLVQVFDSGTVYSFDSAKAGTISVLDSAYSIASGTIIRASGSKDGYSAGDAVNIYAVIYDAANIADAKNYIVSDVLSKSINATGSDLNASFGNMASTASTNMFRNSTYTAAAVPEPTSGPLLLLGMAGLALKRKRA